MVNRNCAYVSGYGARELITEIAGRVPTYSSLGKAWCVQPHTALDVQALAERRGYAVTITEDDPLPTIRGELW